ncbi:cytochrome b5 domain-containing protein [Marinimicrobium alkaliphilum]|uniref:cytochrome b5 domain-containing protein n=1 Tax=Marinimicrobium alkaliphilum TaxID=2202654 RepID=UPI001300B827|nr:cytochrome b5-like heme/steroid binding domain-containing protein [Marinimicrobium alkaliphilum]
MKKTVFAAFIAFWSSIGTLVLVGSLSAHAVSEAEGELSTYTLEQVAEHNTLGSCWMVIEGKVYDFTGYIPRHPTPPVVMEGWCGREATEGMRTKGYGRDHSPAAWGLMEDYLIGELE